MSTSVVRSASDVRNLAMVAFARAPAEHPAGAGFYASWAGNVAALYPASMSIPQVFTDVVNKLAKAPKAQAWVKGIAYEYWKNVESKGAVASARPSGGYTSSGQAPSLVAGTQPASAGAESVALWNRSWFWPVVGVIVLGGAALVLFGSSRGTVAVRAA